MFLAAGCGSQDESVFLHCTVPHLYSSLADRPFSTSSHFRFRICSRGFVGISHPLVGRLCEKVPIESVNMCVFSGFFVFQANFAPSFGHRISDLQEVPNPLFHCFLQWICNTSEVGVLKRPRGFRSAGLFMSGWNNGILRLLGSPDPTGSCRDGVFSDATNNESPRTRPDPFLS